MADRTDENKATARSSNDRYSAGRSSDDRCSEDRSSEDRYKWVALSNTTAGVFMSALDGNA